MRVSDYLAKILYDHGVEDVFLVVGGGCMFLTDGFACHEKINCVPCLHEQAASMAAISYAQYRNGLGACLVTTGCGGTNAITGTLHAYQDNIPVVYISGQCNRNEMMRTAKSKVRNIGMQEADIVPMVSGITKYAVTIMEPENAVYCIQKAIYLAMNGKKGPVWLDIPLDVQEAEIEPDNLKQFDPAELNPVKTVPTSEEVAYIKEAFRRSKRPIVIMGAGIRDSGCTNEFRKLVDRYQIPVVGTRRGWDIIPRNDPLHLGIMDIRGSRSAAMALQNADYILSLGSRLGLVTTGYNYSLFARGADKVIAVDIDEEEHKKGTVRIDRIINADIGELLKALDNIEMPDHREWNEKCFHWKKVLSECDYGIEENENGIGKAAFTRILSEYLNDDDVVVTDAGASTEIPMQSLSYHSANQRYIGSANQCEMGFAIPGVVGVSIARGKKDAICIVGDGSLQMNIQELQTCVTQKLPVKIFVWNNGCYATIIGHQKSIFKGRYVGVDAASGTAFPPLDKIADAYGIKYYRAKTIKELRDALPKVMDEKGPVICDVICWKEETIPQIKARFKTPDGQFIALPPEDMFPPIDRELFEKEMIIEPIKWW